MLGFEFRASSHASLIHFSYISHTTAPHSASWLIRAPHSEWGSEARLGPDQLDRALEGWLGAFRRPRVRILNHRDIGFEWDYEVRTCAGTGGPSVRRQAGSPFRELVSLWVCVVVAKIVHTSLTHFSYISHTFLIPTTCVKRCSKPIERQKVCV